jgi:hypothetical protein
VLFLCVVCVYFGYSSASTLFRLRALKKEVSRRAREKTAQSLAVLHHRAANLSQLLSLSSIAFALCLTVQIPAAFNVLGNSRAPMISIIWRQIGVYIVYAADVLLVLLILRLVQWFVASRVSAATLRLTTSGTANETGSTPPE